MLDGKLAVAELHWVHSRKNGTENAVVGVRFRLQEESGDEKKRKNWTPRGRVQREEQMFVVTFAEEVVSKVQRVGSTVEVKGLPLRYVI